MNLRYFHIDVTLGRTDFVGGIDNEALDFGQLEPFVHLPALNAQNNNGNTSAITLAVTTITAVTTTTASVASSTATTHGNIENINSKLFIRNFVYDMKKQKSIQVHCQKVPQIRAVNRRTVRIYMV